MMAITTNSSMSVKPFRDLMAMLPSMLAAYVEMTSTRTFSYPAAGMENDDDQMPGTTGSDYADQRLLLTGSRAHSPQP
jgi:hypothetical protein